MKYIYSIFFVSAGFISLGQDIQKDEIKRAAILENTENYLRDGGILSDELLKDKLPNKSSRIESRHKDFIIHTDMNIKTEKGIEAVRSEAGNYVSKKNQWIEQNKDLYNGLQNITQEKYLKPEERISQYKN